MAAIRVVAILGLATAALAACGDMAAQRPSAGGPAVTPQAESMKRMVADVTVVRSFAGAGGGDAADRAQAEAAAADLLDWSGRMAELFPPAVAPSLYPDLTEQMVRNAPAAMRRTAEALLSTTRGGDRSAVADRLASVEREGCGACHR